MNESRVIANGPIRLIFELKYPGFETKRITLDAGQNLSKFESHYEADNATTYAIGIKKLAGQFRAERGAGWMRKWEPVANGGEGEFGCAVVVLDPASIVDVTEADGNHLVVARTPAVYYAGAGWNRSGDFKDVADWDRYVDEWAQRIRSPLEVEVSVRP